MVQPIFAQPCPTVNNPGNIIVCSGGQLDVIFTGSSPTATYNWTANLPIFGGLNGTGNISFPVPTIPFPVSVTFTVTATENCTGPAQMFTVTGYPLPTGSLALTGPANICGGQNAVFSVNFSGGNAPYTFVYAIDGVDQAPITTSLNPYTLNLPLTNSATVSLTSITSNTCTNAGTGSAAVNVTPIPVATLTGGSQTICTGQNLDLDVNFNGAGPFTLVYRINGVNQPPVTVSGPTYTLNLMPNAGIYTYTLASVSNNGCTGTVSGNYVLTVKQTPSAALSGDATICAGQSTQLSMNFTGTGPYTVNYTANGVAQTPITTSSSLYSFSVSPTVSTVYELSAVTANGCTGTLNGGASITVNPAPTATLTSGSVNICNGQAVQLQVTFNGPGSYNLVYQLNGVNQPAIVATGPIYTFSAPSGNGNNVYTLASVTANGCPGTTAGTYTAVVGSPPTAVLSGTQMVCPGAPAPLTINFTGSGPFTINYTANNVAQTPITTPNNPYVFNVNPQVPTTYVLTGLTSNGCTGTFSGQAVVSLNPGPTATLVSGSNAFCAGGKDTLQVNLTGGGPYTFIYSINNVAQAPVTAPFDTYFLALQPPAGQDTIRLVSVSNASCSGLVSGQYVIQVFAAPTGTFSADTTICSSSAAQLRLNFTGTPPFIYTYSANGILQSPDTVAVNKDTLFVSPAVTTTYILTSLMGSGCSSLKKDTVVVNVLPELTGEVSGGGQVCQNGSGTQVFFAFQGNGPYIFVYTINGIAQPPITTTLNSYTLNVNPPIGSFYKLLSLTNGFCTGTVSGQAVVFVFSPPTANLSGDATFCTTANTNVLVDFTGTGPFTIYYTQNGVIQAPITTFDDPYFLPVQTSATTTYVLTTTESPGCTGISSGSATITVNYLPSYANISIICDATSTNYQIEFDVLNGTPPYTLVSGAGTFTGNHFVSSSLPIAQSYNFSFNDNSNCGATTVSGVPNCNCTSEAGTMSLSPVTVCQTDTLQVAPATGSFLDADDVLLYLLHTSPGLPLGTLLAWSNQPQFTFLPGMQTNVTYYVSSVVGNAASGQVDQADPCFSVAQGTPVVFHPSPGAVLAATDTSICTGGSATLPITFSGTAPFSFVYSIAGVNQPVVGPINATNYNLSLSPGQNTSVELVSVTDQFCQNGAVSGQANISVQTTPQLGTPTVSCDNNTLTYSLTFDVLAGQAPYTVTGVTGTFNGSTFTSAAYPFGQAYSVTLQDSFQCGQAMFAGTPTCACVSDAGTMAGTSLLKFCKSSPAVAPGNGNQTLDNNDALIYVLHTSAVDSLGTVLATSTTPSFNFIPGTTSFGTIYYISTVVGNSNGAGGVVFTDLCLSVAVGTPVLWNAEPTGTISGTYDVCKGVPLPIKITFTGQGPYTFSYTNNGQTVNATAVQNTYNIIANLQQTTTFILTGVQDANCPGTVSGQAIVTVHQAPDIMNPVVTCSADNQTYTVEFDVLNGGSATITGTVPGNFNAVNGHFISNSIPVAQPYNFQAIDSQYNCGQDSVSGVPVCACTTSAGNLGQTPLVLCIGTAASTPAATGFTLDGNDTLLYYLATMPNPPTWSVLAISATPLFPYNSSTMTPGTTYYIVALAGNVLGGNVDLNDPCLSFATGPTVVWRVPPTGSISGVADICPGGSAALNLQFTGSGPFNFTYTANGNSQTGVSTGSSFTLNVQPADTTMYTIVSVTGTGGCAGTVSGSATVNVHTPPSASLAGDTTICQGGSVAFQIQSIGAPPFQIVYALNGNQQAVTTPLNNFFISSGNIQSPQIFTLISIQDGLCAGTVSGMATVQVNTAPTAALLQDQSICVGDSAMLTLQLSGGAPYNLTIGGGVTPIQLNGLQNGAMVSVQPTVTTTYAITNLVATGNACPVSIGQGATVSVSNLTATAVLSDYQGFNVSCPNESNAAITITPSGGISPFTASWSTGETGFVLQNLSAGTYAVLLTDKAGCLFQDSFLLTSPPAINIAYSLQAPPCFGDVNGALVLDSIAGSTGPYTFQINGQTSQPVDSLPLLIKPLPAGAYNLSVADANGCVTEELFNIMAPPPLLVDLGPDVNLNFGDSTLLEAETNSFKIASYIWTPTTFLQQPNDQATWAKPTQSQTYRVQVRDSFGCTASDDILLVVNKAERVYVPNIINLRSDTYNNVLTVFAGPEVTNVRFLRVYDRWGETVFEGLDLPANEPEFGWSGNFRGKAVQPGVYIYVTEVQYFDGSTEVFSGDVTVVN